MDIEQLISLYIDGQLDEMQIEQLKSQLEQNDEYKAEFYQLLDVVDSLKSLPQQQLPQNFHTEIMNKIKDNSKNISETKINKKSKILNFIPKKIIKISSLAVAACFIFVSIGIFYNTILNNGNTAQNYSQDAMPARSMQQMQLEAETSASSFSYQNENTVGIAMDSSVENYADQEKKENVSDKKIIKTAHLSIQVYDFDSTVENLKQITQQYGGYIENSSSDIIYNDNENDIMLKSGNMVLRVPAQNYNYVIDYVSQTGKIVGNYEQGEDISADYIDTESMLNAKELEKERLMQLIEKADNVNDLILLEERLSQVSGEIDSYNSRIKNWDRLVQFSTISINIEQIREESKINAISPNLNTRMKTGFVSSINNIKQLAENLLVWTAQSIPVIIIIAIFCILAYVVFLVSKKLAGKLKNKKL